MRALGIGAHPALHGGQQAAVRYPHPARHPTPITACGDGSFSPETEEADAAHQAALCFPLVPNKDAFLWAADTEMVKMCGRAEW